MASSSSLFRACVNIDTAKSQYFATGCYSPAAELVMCYRIINGRKSERMADVNVGENSDVPSVAWVAVAVK